MLANIRKKSEEAHPSFIQSEVWLQIGLLELYWSKMFLQSYFCFSIVYSNIFFFGFCETNSESSELWPVFRKLALCHIRKNLAMTWSDKMSIVFSDDLFFVGRQKKAEY